MRPPESSQYISLDGAAAAVQQGRPASIALRFMGFAASWFLLAAFLAVQPLYMRHPDLRGGSTVALTVAAASLTLGLGFTTILRFTDTSNEFRANFIYLPCLSSCTLGVVITPFSFAIFTEAKWNPAATVSIVVAVLTTLLYVTLILHAFNELSPRQIINNITKRKAARSMRVPTLTPNWPEERPSVLYPADEYFPSRVKPGNGGDEELMHAQMRTLLLRSERPGSGASSTFHLEMPNAPRATRNEPHNSMDLPSPPKMSRDEYRNSLELPKHVADYYGSEGEDVERDPQVELEPPGRLRPESQPGKGRSRSRSAASREERRIQIESGG